ncbi:vacuolar protein sorting-associated protein 41 homolog [Diadema antillarum]|uniref:vacuolar protein sorting-associated protein 41 homolog n=1 Tax=Diadema antillarum TaxID=105358 RepID=UPI003A8BF679
MEGGGAATNKDQDQSGAGRVEEEEQDKQRHLPGTAKDEEGDEEEEDDEDDDDDDDDDDEDDEDEDDDDDENEEDADEPKLKYERISNTLESILNSDAASYLAVHTKFLAVGTHWGVLHVLDHQGNTISGKEFTKHTTTVNQVSLDMNGDYLASCSDDGRVAITGLYEGEHNQVQSFDRPVKAVALDPKFSRPGSGKQFITGSDRLVLHEKGFLGRSKSTILHHGEGPIRSIKWRASLVAWANDLGVKVYDMHSKRRITFIKRSHPETMRPELYRCNLCWKDDNTLLIGWANTIKICCVRERMTPESRDLPSKYVEITSMFTTDFTVCGLAPLNSDLVVLAYVTDGPKNEGEDSGACRPQLKIITPSPDDYQLVTSDALSMRGFQAYRPNDYHLEYLEDEGVFYIVSPKDVVVARQRDMDDHINWLLQFEKYEEALAEARRHAKDLIKIKVQDVGRSYLNHLFSTGQFEKAASLCPSILGKNKELWENEVYLFAKLRKLKVISHYVPRGDLRLSKAIYEMILNEYLQTDIEGFHKLIKLWPPDLYDLMTLVSAVTERLTADPENRALMQTLGELYLYDQRYDKALAIYLRLGHEDVFKLIHKRNLFDSIQDKIVLLMRFDTKQAIEMLITNTDKVAVKKVVSQLQEDRRLLYLYLDALFQKDANQGRDFHAMQVELYAEFDRERLLPFLKTSNYYPLQQALDQCEQRNFTKEMVFLLGRMGNTKQALRLITEELKDVEQAIVFAKEHDDAELWDDLIDYSMDKPPFITGLLNNIGTHVDPIILIKRIKAGMEIPGLRDSLVKILHDYNLQIMLREGCKKILVSDCFSLMKRLNKIQKRGVRVQIDERQSCDCCHQPLQNSEPPPVTVVFYCHHTFHEECLLSQNMTHCLICHSQRRGPGSVASAFMR